MEKLLLIKISGQLGSLTTIRLDVAEIRDVKEHIHNVNSALTETFGMFKYLP